MASPCGPVLVRQVSLTGGLGGGGQDSMATSADMYRKNVPGPLASTIPANALYPPWLWMTSNAPSGWGPTPTQGRRNATPGSTFCALIWSTFVRRGVATLGGSVLVGFGDGPGLVVTDAAALGAVAATCGPPPG